MNIKGLNKAEVLAALYNSARAQGMGFLHYDKTPMTVNQAQELLASGEQSFDYLKGRVMKISLTNDEVSTWSYNRDNGVNAAENAIKSLEHSGDVNNSSIVSVHAAGTLDAAATVKAHLCDESIIERNSGIVHMTLGYADVADAIGPKIDQVLDENNGHF